MIVLSLPQAYALAQEQAPGITKDQFLEQTRLALLDGRIRAKAFDCIYRDDPEELGVSYRVLRPNAPSFRQEIPQEEWRNLNLYLANGGGACAWGHDRAPEHYQGLEIDGSLEGLPVHGEPLLTARSFAGVWVVDSPRAPSMTDADLRRWIADYEDAEGEPPIKDHWNKSAELKGRGVTREQWREVWDKLYQVVKRGRRPEIIRRK
ncbi:MAG: hypothetical protein EKK29_09475 [Hyphomicrobiales bacterium]|nr:MAG: hypothetical protein EKK29_09475 [Hyphomicrobiales bacterium]